MFKKLFAKKTQQELLRVPNKLAEFPAETMPLLSGKREKDGVFYFDWAQLKKMGFISPDEPHSLIAEQFRAIKRPLVKNAIDFRKTDIQRSNLVLLTSSVPNEGKTFSSINLALSIAADLDRRVLLIDADVAKGSISSVLGIQRTEGLMEYLEGKVENFSDLIITTEIEGLKIIPAGRQHKYSTELLASDRMIALAKELSMRYDDRIVIFDTPPVLAATQAEVLASLVGQVILVIAADSTPQGMVLDAVQKLESCTDVLLTLLNKHQKMLGDYHTYGYGYGYGRY